MKKTPCEAGRLCTKYNGAEKNTSLAGGSKKKVYPKQCTQASPRSKKKCITAQAVPSAKQKVIWYISRCRFTKKNCFMVEIYSNFKFSQTNSSESNPLKPTAAWADKYTAQK